MRGDFTSTLVFFVNGKKVEDDQVDPAWSLLYYLRNTLRLCGTKLACGEGGCGACTVMVSRYNRELDKIDHIPVNACLAPICSMHGSSVTTIEGIGSTSTKLHPVQERIAKAHGSQCGFCTPGMVMSMYTVLRNSPKPTMKELEIAFQGNLCRCTGYRPIIEGFRTFTEKWELFQRCQQLNGIKGTCGLGKNCCQAKSAPNGEVGLCRKISEGACDLGRRKSCCKIDTSNNEVENHGKILNRTCVLEENIPNGGTVISEKIPNGTCASKDGNKTSDIEVYESLAKETCALGDHFTKTTNNGIVSETYASEDGRCKTKKISSDKTESNQKINGFNEVNSENPTRSICENFQGQKCQKDYPFYKQTNKFRLQNGNTGFTTETKVENGRLFNTDNFTPYHPSQEPIFPPELKLTDRYDKQNLLIQGPEITWYRPTTLEALLEIKESYPDAKLVVGNTETGIEMKFKYLKYPVLLQPGRIPELTELKTSQNGVKLGASATFNDIGHFLQEQIDCLPEYKTRIFKAIVDMLNWFAGKQIRSVGSIGGNIMTGSPVSDMLPILMATRVELDVQSFSSGIRSILLDANFFTGYRKTIIKPEEVLKTIHIPYSSRDQYCYAYKQARRREDDIAIVNFAINVIFKPRSHIVSKIRLAFGGMSFKTVTAPKTEERLTGLPWDSNTLEIAYGYLLEDLPLDFGAPGGMVLYRKSLALSLFFKAFLTISQRLQEYIPSIQLSPRNKSAIEEFSGTELKSSQFFSFAPGAQNIADPVQKPIVHMSAYKQATGEAVYLDDIPHFENELYMGLVLSTKPHAKILSIDPSKALAMPGVYGFFSSRDLHPNNNKIGSFLEDESVFYSDLVTSQGQIIAIVVAEDKETAQRAAKFVKVEYEDLEPVILTIEDAIEKQSFFSFKRQMLNGDVNEALRKAPNVLTGECRMGGQEHFYFETHCTIAVPLEDEMHIYTSSQHPTEVTQMIAKILNMPQHKVVGKVKRLGGGFGGKESKAALIAVPAAIAAAKLNRPVRCVLDRDEDIVMTGGRHPFLMKYTVGFNDDGKILGCDIVMYSNCGYSADLSFAVLGRAMNHFENAYFIPASRIRGFACKTNLPSNTAFRGFGAPQGMYVAECMIQHIADFLGKDVVKVSERNLYKEGDLTHYKQELVDCTIQRCWRELMESSDYYSRRKIADRFNRDNRYKKRGLSVIPTKFGIGFTKAFMNQGGALILVYTDGSVLLSHGGVEMGQGLHTKMIQIASTVLEIPPEKFHISETTTDKVPNTSPTAASSGSDINGIAVMEACQIIKERLKPFKEANPEGCWEDWVKQAYMDRVSLSATGFCKIPDVGYDFEKGEGRMFNYFTYGTAVTEVEIDTLSGDHQVLRTDIIMDLGQSLNPAIDIGQIEGGFVQGYGLFVMEEMMYSPEGMTYTRGPGTYKIPGFGDIPREFNVSLLKGSSNPRAVYSSKAVGEPPLFLASSVLFAIKDAIKAARLEFGNKEFFRLDAPATPAKVRMACQDDITAKVGKEPDSSTYKPWNITV